MFTGGTIWILTHGHLGVLAQDLKLFEAPEGGLLGHIFKGDPFQVADTR